MGLQKVVVITGASSGIGLALALAYDKPNVALVLAARSVDALNELAGKLRHAKSLVVQTDVANEADCKRLVDSAIEAFGRIDILINNAGISMRASFSEVEMDVLRRVMDVNYWGTVYCTKYALPWIIESKGSIVGVSSTAGIRGLPVRVGYSASKFAMNGFLEGLRTEMIPLGVHVLTALPGFTQSNIRKNSLGRKGGEKMRDEAVMMTAEEVARRIVRAIETRKRVLVMTRLGHLTVFIQKFLPVAWVDSIVLANFRKEEGL
jgi:short-subunit dehydrogenase